MSKKLELLKAHAELSIRYRGDVFTVVCASVDLSNINGNPNHKIINAEGISRRSHLDKQNEALGDEIAAGRAIRALHKKIIDKKPVRHKYMG